MNNKECEILGFSKVTIKETHEEKYRICIAINSQNESYIGKTATFVFLPVDDMLEIELKNYLNGSYRKCYYETTDNIVTGKTKVTKLNFE